MVRWTEPKCGTIMRGLDAKYSGDPQYGRIPEGWRLPWAHDALNRLTRKIERDHSVPAQSIYALYPPEVAEHLRNGDPGIDGAHAVL